MNRSDDFSGVSRRDFMKVSAMGVAAAGGAASGAGAVAADAASAKVGTPETVVTTLYQSLSDEQKKMICFPFENDLRHEIENNWRITKARVGRDFSKDQQAMIREIVRGMHSPEYVDKVMKQVAGENGGLSRCSVALFGEPGTGKFEFVFTGRHVTRRCDGDSSEGTAFGGPIFYGHAGESFHEKPDHPGNVYWYQGLRANEVYQALDGKQRKAAMRTDPRREDGFKTVEFSKAAEMHGIPMTDLTDDQKKLVRAVIGDVLAPFRKADADEAMKLIEQAGFDKLRMAFYKGGRYDIGNDGVWDVWQIEGPSMIMYFRGAPHVHAWAHILAPKA